MLYLSIEDLEAIQEIMLAIRQFNRDAKVEVEFSGRLIVKDETGMLGEIYSHEDKVVFAVARNEEGAK